MSRVGLDWYKREPQAYLGDVQGLTAKEHAVYSVVIDLLYVHGGEINNDPAFIAGWILDMGSASVRRVLVTLSSNKNITLVVTKDTISQKRAKNQVKTRGKPTENQRKTNGKPTENTSDLEASGNENKDLADGNNQPPREEKRRVEYIDDDEDARAAKSTSDQGGLTERERVLMAMGHDKSGMTANGRILGSPGDVLEMKRWQSLGITFDEIIEVVAHVSQQKRDGPAISFKYFTKAMEELAGKKNAPPLEPKQMEQSNAKFRNNRSSQGGKRIDPALEQIARLAGLEDTQGNGRS